MTTFYCYLFTGNFWLSVHLFYGFKNVEILGDMLQLYGSE